MYNPNQYKKFNEQTTDDGSNVIVGQPVTNNQVQTNQFQQQNQNYQQQEFNQAQQPQQNFQQMPYQQYQQPQQINSQMQQSHYPQYQASNVQQGQQLNDQQSQFINSAPQLNPNAPYQINHVGSMPIIQQGSQNFQLMPVDRIPQSNKPQLLFCDYCKKAVTSKVHHEVGTGAWLLGGLIACCGFWQGCCLVPCCLKECKDALHFCEDCGSHLGKKKFLIE